MISPGQAEAYLHERIPLSRLMGVRVAALDGAGARLWAPLAPNVNHRGTAFGGSASALAMLAGWALVHARIVGPPRPTRLVIRRSQIEFDEPIDGDFEAWCPAPDAQTWARFDAGLAQRGKGRIDLTIEVQREGRSVGTFRGQYVAVRE